MEEGSVTAQETGFNEDLVDEAKPLLIDQSKSDAPDREEKEIVECENDKQENKVKRRFERWRNYFGFWLLGICTNFPYVVMLSSAYDILDNLSQSSNEPDEFYNSSCTLYYNDTTNTSTYAPRECLPHGTYQFLLADVLPAFLIKLTFPYFMHHIPYWIRVVCVVAAALSSFIIVALGTSIAVVLVGVVCASISGGIGEITFLALTARYHKFTVAGWSSGTGAAGVGGALAYTGLSTFLSPRDSLLIQLVVPIVMMLSYVFVITKPEKINYQSVTSKPEENESKDGVKTEDDLSLKNRRFKFEFYRKSELSVLEHLRFIPQLLGKYMIWLFLVYAAEYMINQSLFESLYYPNTNIGKFCLSQSIQYKWYQVMYQFGVFISRSSLTVVHIKYFHVMAILQVFNFVLLLLEVIYQFVPYFWITLFIVLYEGLLGGAVYANAFYSISQKVESSNTEFSMGLASVADTTGIAVAGLLSSFIHSYICSLGY